MRRVCVVGLGEVGLKNAIYCCKKGMQTFGVDIYQEARDYARDEHGIPTYDAVRDVPEKVDVFLICVGTKFSKDLRGIDVSAVYDVAEQIGGLPYVPLLVVIESTVPPSTTRDIYEKHLKHTYVAHVAHRYWENDPDKRGVRRFRNLAGVDDESYQRAITFYQQNLDMPINVVNNLEVAEMSKLAENAYRYVRIAFAEELCMICDSLELDFNEVREAVNVLGCNPPIMEARGGIHGSCLPMAIDYTSSESGVVDGVSSASIWTDAVYQSRRRKE